MPAFVTATAMAIGFSLSALMETLLRYLLPLDSVAGVLNHAFLSSALTMALFRAGQHCLLPLPPTVPAARQWRARAMYGTAFLILMTLFWVLLPLAPYLPATREAQTAVRVGAQMLTYGLMFGAGATATKVASPVKGIAS